jgi:hypothetical protein
VDYKVHGPLIERLKTILARVEAQEQVADSTSTADSRAPQKESEGEV